MASIATLRTKLSEQSPPFYVNYLQRQLTLAVLFYLANAPLCALGIRKLWQLYDPRVGTHIKEGFMSIMRPEKTFQNTQLNFKTVISHTCFLYLIY